MRDTIKAVDLARNDIVDISVVTSEFHAPHVLVLRVADNSIVEFKNDQSFYINKNINLNSKHIRGVFQGLDVEGVFKDYATDDTKLITQADDKSWKMGKKKVTNKNVKMIGVSPNAHRIYLIMGE